MKSIVSILLAGIVASSSIVFGQFDGDIIINEIGNSGTQKGAYAGGDFVELLVLLKSWSRDGAVSAVVWGGTSRWTGCKPTELPIEALANGIVAWFAMKTRTVSDFRQNSDPQFWISSKDPNDASPGRKNKGADDSVLLPKKE